LRRRQLVAVLLPDVVCEPVYATAHAHPDANADPDTNPDANTDPHAHANTHPDAHAAAIRLSAVLRRHLIADMHELREQAGLLLSSQRRVRLLRVGHPKDPVHDASTRQKRTL
jgi:hypothetical protein